MSGEFNCDSCDVQSEELHQRGPYNGNTNDSWYCDECYESVHGKLNG